MKTEIDALIKALDAFKAKLVESEQPPVAEDWIYLHDLEYARRSGYLASRCLRKDSPYPCHHEPEVKPAEPVVWPQYWSATTGVTVFVRRDSPTITVSVDPKGRETKWASNWSSGDELGRIRLTEEEALAKLADPEKELLAKAQDNAGDGVEVDSYHRLGWYRMAGGGIARIKRTYDEIACSIVFGDVVEAGSTFTDQVWNKTTGSHETNSDWNLIRWKGGEQ